LTINFVLSFLSSVSSHSLVSGRSHWPTWCGSSRHAEHGNCCRRLGGRSWPARDARFVEGRGANALPTPSSGLQKTRFLLSCDLPFNPPSGLLLNPSFGRSFGRSESDPSRPAGPTARTRLPWACHGGACHGGVAKGSLRAAATKARRSTPRWRRLGRSRRCLSLRAIVAALAATIMILTVAFAS
jgi:hypothetical protein